MNVTTDAGAARLDHVTGCLIGLAVGDALGATNELIPRDRVKPITGMSGGGAHGLRPGEWTDDTSMALCLAESIIERDEFDAEDQMTRYLRWYREGYLSSKGECFAIGNTTRAALERFERDGNPWAGPVDRHAAGNGSLMRLAAVPMRWWRNDFRDVERYAAMSSRTTHAAPQAVDACRYFAVLIAAAMRGASKDDLLCGVYEPDPGFWASEPLDHTVITVASGSWRSGNAQTIPNGGYVIDSLETALWGFARFDDFASGALAIANLGGDSDTNAAIYGQLAGAYYGRHAIPDEWRDALAKSDVVNRYAGILAQQAVGTSEART